MVKVNLRLTKIGTVKLHLHRDMAGDIKTLTIKREGEHWRGSQSRIKQINQRRWLGSICTVVSLQGSNVI